MKILTLNTWQERGPWRERWELILKGLKEYDADIAGLQEVFSMEWAEEARKRSGYPYLAVSGRHSGLIFLSRFKPVGQECIVFEARSPNEDYLRYAFHVEFDTGKGAIALFNTHLSWQARDEDVRMRQVSELAGFVDRKAKGLPAAILGDFNTAPDTAPVIFARDSRNWVDTYAKANPDSAGLTWNYRNPYAAMEKDKMAERRIDYIFVTPRSACSGGVILSERSESKDRISACEKKSPFAKIVSSKLVFDKPDGEVWPSDHFGVLTEFSGQGSGDREQGTGNREQGAGNRGEMTWGR